MTAYYNDIDPEVCAWLRELIAEGLIATGEVDNRSILDVEPAELSGFTQCHFFAGIGGWSAALRLAGIPDNAPVWTGSPPCQPFSVAGDGLARDDPRHLGPHFISLVRACRPGMLFGEQVASPEVIGRVAKSAKQAEPAEPAWAWWDDIQARLQAARYATGLSVRTAAGAGAPHIRQRVFFGAVADGDSLGRIRRRTGEEGLEPRKVERSTRLRPDGSVADGAGLQGRVVCGHGADQRTSRASGLDGHRAYQDKSFWGGADWIGCTDGTFRPTKPGLQPLANGVSGRMGRLRGAGNAIVPQVAARFVRDFLEVHLTT